MSPRSTSEPWDNLQIAVRQFWSAFGRNATHETCAVWAKTLRDIPERFVFRAFTEAKENPEGGVPSLGAILSRARKFEHTANWKPSETHKLTQAEREKSDGSCVMSGLWLHYECGWPLERIAGEVVGRQLGLDPIKALEEARKRLPRERVHAWMSAHARKDPLACDAEHAAKGRLSVQ